MDTIGLARGIVRLSPYDPEWPTVFMNERRLLQGALALPTDSINRIQHVGSTSIPGMMAKPIIDIAVLVDSLETVEAWRKPLEKIGYWYKDDQSDVPDRRFFAKGPEQKRTVYLHIVNRGEFNRLLRFRDTLTNDQHLAAAYSHLKQQLAQANPEDRATYSRLKHDFIQGVLAP